MNRCLKCGVDISVPRNKCPLCHNKIDNIKSGREIFPFVPTVYNKYGLIFRIIIFLSIITAVVSITINLLVPSESYWFLIVIAGLIGMWFSVLTTIRKRRNISKNLLWQAVIMSLVLASIDALTGWMKWSINYVIPSMFVFTMLSIAIIAIIMHRKASDFSIYLIVDGLLGLLPLVFIIFNWVDVIWPSLMCVLVSITSLAAIMIFIRNMEIELKKRFHV